MHKGSGPRKSLCLTATQQLKWAAKECQLCSSTQQNSPLLKTSQSSLGQWEGYPSQDS